MNLQKHNTFCTNTYFIQKSVIYNVTQKTTFKIATKNQNRAVVQGREATFLSQKLIDGQTDKNFNNYL